VAQGDPSLSLVQAAVTPTASSGTPGWLLLGVILAVGLAVGTATALALEALDRRRSAGPDTPVAKTPARRPPERAPAGEGNGSVRAPRASRRRPQRPKK
jgi:hypothetical protein